MLVALAGCESSSDDDTPGASSGRARFATSAPAGNDDAAARNAYMQEFLTGRWVRAEGDTTMFWHFAGDLSFHVGFDDNRKSDLTLFPRGLRNKAPKYVGRWRFDGDTLVLQQISGPSQALIDELRVRFEKIDAETIKIDGEKFVWREIQPLAPAPSADGSDDD